jgi:hypothetical protein
MASCGIMFLLGRKNTARRNKMGKKIDEFGIAVQRFELAEIEHFTMEKGQQIEGDEEPNETSDIVDELSKRTLASKWRYAIGILSDGVTDSFLLYDKNGKALGKVIVMSGKYVSPGLKS